VPFIGRLVNPAADWGHYKNVSAAHYPLEFRRNLPADRRTRDIMTTP
jgi:hypothetical protein